MKPLENYSKWSNKEESRVSLKCSFNPKEGRQTEKKKKNRWDQWKMNSKMVDWNSNINWHIKYRMSEHPHRFLKSKK